MDQSRHGEGLTSVKVHHQPGGASSFSLGGGYGDDGAADRQRRPGGQAKGAAAPFGTEEIKQQEWQPAAQAQAAAVPGQQNPNQGAGVAATFDVFGNQVKGTSVKVHAPPGGKSSITF